MLTPADVVALAERAGIGAHGAALVETMRPGWRLEPARGGDPSIAGATKIGGGADLADGEAWPRNDRGISLTLLAQVDTRSLPAFDAPWADHASWTPDGRLVRIFADLVDVPFEPCAARVLECSPDVPLRRVGPPPLPDPWPPGGPWDDLEPEDRFAALPEHPVRAVAFLSAPEMHPQLRPGPFDLDGDAGSYSDWCALIARDGADDGYAPICQLLGHPASIQDDVRSAARFVLGEQELAAAGLDDEAAWNVLLELTAASEFDLPILDGGAFTVLVPSADLAAGRYDRAVCSVDSC